MRTSQSIVFGASAIALVACSAVGPAIPTAPQTAAAYNATSTHPTRASITIQWSAEKAAMHARAPRFVSPSAQSVLIEAASVDRPSKDTSTIVNRPKTGTRTKATFDVPAGGDQFIFTVFDRKNGTGNGIGGAQVVKTMPAGVTTTVGVALEGYVAKATLTPQTGGEFLKNYLDTNHTIGYTLVGTQQVTASVTLMDADGNVLLPSQSGASISLASSVPSLIALHRVSGGSDRFVIQAVAPNPAFTPVAIDLQVTSGTGGSQLFSQQFAVQEEALLYAGASGSRGSVTLFDQEGKKYSAAGGFPGIKNPVAMEWDNFDGVLFVADAGRKAILAYDGEGNALPGWTIASVPGITSLTYNHDTHEVYAVVTQSAGAAHDAVLAFDLHGHPAKVGDFSQAGGATTIAYTNWATMNNPTGVDRFWLITTQANGTAILRSYSANGSVLTFTVNGVPVKSETLTGSGFVPSALSAQWPSWVTSGSRGVGGTGSQGVTIVGTYNGAGALDNGVTPFTGGGLKQPRIAVEDPLFDYFSGLNILNQPIEYYVVNGTGGLDVLEAVNGLEQDTSVSYPPPAGATSFSALAVTF